MTLISVCRLCNLFVDGAMKNTFFLESKGGIGNGIPHDFRRPCPGWMYGLEIKHLYTRVTESRIDVLMKSLWNTIRKNISDTCGGPHNYQHRPSTIANDTYPRNYSYSKETWVNTPNSSKVCVCINKTIWTQNCPLFSKTDIKLICTLFVIFLLGNDGLLKRIEE